MIVINYQNTNYGPRCLQQAATWDAQGLVLRVDLVSNLDLVCKDPPLSYH
jgi:hypothetical protein